MGARGGVDQTQIAEKAVDHARIGHAFDGAAGLPLGLRIGEAFIMQHITFGQQH